MAKRLISTGIGLIILCLIMFSNSMLIFNLALTIIALIGLSEFYKAFKNKNAKPVSTLGYIVTLGLFFVNSDYTNIKNFLIFILPIMTLFLFCKIVFSNAKTNIQDIMITLFGLIYVPFFLMFMTLTRRLEFGEYYIWYILFGAWITDSAAYLIGSKFGKHKFSKISPNKSVEGAVSGIITTAIVYGIYTYFLNNVGITLNCAEMVIVGAIVSVISQIGDLAASSIKRYCEIKDFGKIMPGHGGILDRFDSIIMISPFIYMFLQFLG